MTSLFKNRKFYIAFVIFVVVYSIFFWCCKENVRSNLIVFASDLGVMTALASFILSQLDQIEQHEEEQINEFIQQQESGFIEVERQFLKCYPELFPLYKEMHIENPILQSLPDPPQIDATKRIQYECNMFNIITQTIENILLLVVKHQEVQKLPSYNEWLQTWQQWFRSPTLCRLWNINRSYYFSPSTVQFIDKLIVGVADPVIQSGGRRTFLSKGRLAHFGWQIPYLK